MQFDYPYNESGPYVTGHVYAECYLPEGRFLVDPMKGLIIKLFSEENKLTMYRIKDYQYMIEVFSGLDNFDAGIKSHEEQLKAMKVTLIESMKKNHL